MNAEKPRWVKVLGVTMTLLGAAATYHLQFVGGSIMGPLILFGPTLLIFGLLLLWWSRSRSRPGSARPGVRLLVSGLVMLVPSLILIMLSGPGRTDERLGMMLFISLIYLAAPGLLMVFVGIIRVVGSRPTGQQ